MPAIKKIPERMCSGCGTHRPKRELIRVVRSPEGEVSLDLTGRKNGRGAYLCPLAECLRKARRTRRIERSLGCPIPDEVYDLMEEELRQREG